MSHYANDWAPHTTNLSPARAPDWRDQARCATLSSESIEALFFLAVGHSASKARRFCALCPVQQQCLAEGCQRYYHEGDGIWGGRTPRERERIRAGLPVRPLIDPPPLEPEPEPEPVKPKSFKPKLPTTSADHLARTGHIPEYDRHRKCRICTRNQSRDRQRLARGIPLTAPVRRTRPRIATQKEAAA